MNQIINILGWVGTVTYLIAYGLVSAKRVESDSYAYQGMNIFAGVFLVMYTYQQGAYAATSLNFIWAGIGIVTLILKGRKQ